MNRTVDGVARRAAHAESILRAAIVAADPRPRVRRAITTDETVRQARHVHLLAIGKAAAPMAAAALESLVHAPESGVVIVPHGARVDHDSRIPVMYAAHPIPDTTSTTAARVVEELLANARADDLILALLSGGASALCAAPVDAITIEQYAGIVRDLLRAGADIGELNTVRQHIDRLKGGGMAQMAAPAHVLSLVVSDVVGNPLDIIASGPLCPARTTPRDAARVLESYGLWSTTPDAIRRALENDAPPPGFDRYSHVRLDVIVDNRVAVEGAARAAALLGYDVKVNATPVIGMARDAGSRLAHDAIRVAASLPPGARPVCMLSGGETTVVVSGTGVGGRNQELVLAAALALNGVPAITVGSIGTDGIDGNTDAAGAVADGHSVARGATAGFDAALALENNDSHSFFDGAGGLIRTGATGTNVMDVHVALMDADLVSVYS